MGIKEQSNDWQPFDDQEDFMHLIDIIASVYGKLPSEVIKLDWFDFMFCIKCLKYRGMRLGRLTKQYKRSGIQPTISLTDLIDQIG